MIQLVLRAYMKDGKWSIQKATRKRERERKSEREKEKKRKQTDKVIEEWKENKK